MAPGTQLAAMLFGPLFQGVLDGISSDEGGEPPTKATKKEEAKEDQDEDKEEEEEEQAEQEEGVTSHGTRRKNKASDNSLLALLDSSDEEPGGQKAEEGAASSASGPGAAFSAPGPAEPLWPHLPDSLKKELRADMACSSDGVMSEAVKQAARVVEGAGCRERVSFSIPWPKDDSEVVWERVQAIVAKAMSSRWGAGSSMYVGGTEAVARRWLGDDCPHKVAARFFEKTYICTHYNRKKQMGSDCGCLKGHSHPDERCGDSGEMTIVAVGSFGTMPRQQN